MLAGPFRQRWSNTFVRADIAKLGRATKIAASISKAVQSVPSDRRATLAALPEILLRKLDEVAIARSPSSASCGSAARLILRLILPTAVADNALAKSFTHRNDMLRLRSVVYPLACD